VPDGARFPSTSALRRLGIVDPTVFYPEGGRMTPTIQIADLSRSVSTEPVEARAIIHAIHPPAIGFHATFELYCRAPGGLIVEGAHLAFPPDSSDVGSSVDGAQLQIDNTTLIPQPPPPSPLAHLNIGGIAVRSLTARGNTLPGGGGQRWHNDFTHPIYVRSGEVFRIVTQQTNIFLFFTMTWRELDEIQPQ